MENADRFFKNKKQLTGWIDQPSIVPLLEHLKDKKLKEKFRNLVVSNMIKETIKEDGTCFETFRRINVFAKKK